MLQGLPADFVSRPELVTRLSDASGALLALVVAPPGYGKTALLREWSGSDDRTFAWVEFEERRNSRRAVVRDTVRATLRRSLAVERGVVLVLDNAHVVAPDQLAEIFDDAIHELPHGSTIAVSSRTEPALPLGRLRAQRAMVEIRMHDLSMAPAQAQDLLRKAGLELEPEDVDALARITEGWPAALYLAALSLNQHDDVHANVRSLGGDDHYLASYLRDEFLCALSPEMLQFVTRTSVLDELSGPLCDAVLGEHGTGTMLAQLERLSPLLVPLDTAHTRYRWHPLLRDALGAELRRADPELEPQLHSVASTWCEGRGDVDCAIAHAAAAGDAGRVGKLLWPRVLSYTLTQRNRAVRAWIASLNPGQLTDNAALAVCAAYSALASGRLSEAQQWRVDAAHVLGHGDVPSPDQSLEAGAALLDAFGARVSAAAMGAAAVRAHALADETSPWRPLSCLSIGVSAHLMGDHEQACRLLEEGADLGAVTAPTAGALCLAQRLMIAIEESDWELASGLSEQTMRLVSDSDLEPVPILALVYASLAAAQAHRGLADEAKRDLRVAVDLLAELGDFVPWYEAEVRILLAHASMWLADVVGARTLLAEASRFARRVPDAVVFTHWFDDAWAYMDTLAETSLSGASSLTIAELRILRFLPSHRSFREIGAQLGVSANTVKTQAHAVYRKLGAASRSEAVARAAEVGLLGQ